MDQELNDILKKYHNESYHWALLLCKYDKDMAKDVLQTAYLKVLENKNSFRGKSSFKTWLFTVIKNAVSDQKRRSMRIVFQNDFKAFEKVSEAKDESINNPLIMSLIEGLSEMQRNILQLIFYHNHTIEECAEILKKPVGTVRSHYARGKENLRKIIEENNLKQQIYE